MKLNAQHIAFRKGAALAFLRTAESPDLPVRELSGSYVALCEEFKRTRVGLGTLKRMIKPRSARGLGRLAILDGQWSFTSDDVQEYEPFIDEARKSLSVTSAVAPSGG